MLALSIRPAGATFGERYHRADCQCLRHSSGCVCRILRNCATLHRMELLFPLAAENEKGRRCSAKPLASNSRSPDTLQCSGLIIPSDVLALENRASSDQ